MEGADRGPGEAGRGHARFRKAHPHLQAARPHLGREAVARAELARELAEGSGDRSAGRRRPAGHRRQLPKRRGVGGAFAGAPSPHSGGSAGGQRGGGRRAERAVCPARRARRRHPDAHPGRHRCVARGARAGADRVPRTRGPRAPVHAGGPLGGGGRHSRAARRGARQSHRARRRPHAGGVALGRQDRRRRFGCRGLRTGAGHRSGPPDGVDRARAALPPAQELGEAGRPAARPHRVRVRRGGADRAAGPGGGDLRTAAQ